MNGWWVGGVYVAMTDSEGVSMIGSSESSIRNAQMVVDHW